MQPNLASLCRTLSIFSVCLHHAVFIASSPTPVRASSSVDSPTTTSTLDLVPSSRESLSPPPVASQAIKEAAKEEPDLLGPLGKLLSPLSPSQAVTEGVPAPRESAPASRNDTTSDGQDPLARLMGILNPAGDSAASRQSESAAANSPSASSPSSTASGDTPASRESTPSARNATIANDIPASRASIPAPAPTNSAPPPTSPSSTAGGDAPAHRDSVLSRNATLADGQDAQPRLNGTLKTADDTPAPRESKAVAAPTSSSSGSPPSPTVGGGAPASRNATDTEGKDPLARLLGVLNPADEAPAPRESTPAATPSKEPAAAGEGDPLARLLGVITPAGETAAPRESAPAATPSKEAPATGGEDPLGRLLGVLQPGEETPASRESAPAAPTATESAAARETPKADSGGPLGGLTKLLNPGGDAPQPSESTAPRESQPVSAPPQSSSAAAPRESPAPKEHGNPLAKLTQLLNPNPPSAAGPVPAPRESQVAAESVPVPQESQPATSPTPAPRESQPANNPAPAPRVSQPAAEPSSTQANAPPVDEVPKTREPDQGGDPLGPLGKAISPDAIGAAPKAVKGLLPFISMDGLPSDDSSKKETPAAQPIEQPKTQSEDLSTPPPSTPPVPGVKRLAVHPFRGGRERTSMFDPVASYRQHMAPEGNRESDSEEEDDPIAGLPRPKHRYSSRQAPSIGSMLPTVKNALSPADTLVKGTVPGAPGVGDLLPNMKSNSVGDTAKDPTPTSTPTSTATDVWITHVAGFESSKWGAPGRRRRRLRRAESPMVSYLGQFTGALGTVAKSAQAAAPTGAPVPLPSDNPLSSLLGRSPDYKHLPLLEFIDVTKVPAQLANAKSPLEGKQQGASGAPSGTSRREAPPQAMSGNSL